MGKREDGKNIVFGVCDEMCSVMEKRGWLERVADGAMPGCWQPTDAGREAIMALVRGEHGKGVMSIKTPQHAHHLRMLDLNGSRIPLSGCTGMNLSVEPGEAVRVDMSFVPPVEA